MKDSFQARGILNVGDKKYQIFKLSALEKLGHDISRLPYSLKILLENLLRKENGTSVDADDILAVATWDPQATSTREIVYSPARILMQDFTGVPALVDLAAMRDAMTTLGGDPKLINPVLPVELVIDHSIQVDSYGRPDSMDKNLDLDYERNSERYSFLRWGQNTFQNFSVVPPNSGIVHQVNLENLARVVFSTDENKNDDHEIPFAYPDSCVGTDSHTPMVNGLGILAWGVGGIEAEATMLGQSITMLIPQVIGFKLEGELPEGATSTDLVLTVTEMLRNKGVVGKFVEFYGPGVSSLTIADRATIGNMSPEYGATCAIFPPDEITLQYLRLTGRSQEKIDLVEAYMKEQGLFHRKDSPEPKFTDTLTLNLKTVEPCIAGPRRPHERIPLSKISFLETMEGIELPTIPRETTDELQHLSIVMAAITSCTNTSNPSVMLAAGLLAKKAVEHGLQIKPWIKTSLAPGSKVVTSYFERAGLTPYLNKLGFNLTGYGCTTCIGNSGPLDENISKQINEKKLIVAAVLSGNRNYEGRINPDVRANFLMSPPLVIAFALAGSMKWDPYTEPIGLGKNGNPVFLKDIWPTQREIAETAQTVIQPEMYRSIYQDIYKGGPRWAALNTPKGDRYVWDEKSIYVRQPSLFENITKEAPSMVEDLKCARVLAYLGDSVTTDHISPAGSIKKESPAGKYLAKHGIEYAQFNTYGARRGNHEVMVRGTFANPRIRNKLAPNIEGGCTTYLPKNETMPIYDAAMLYQRDGTNLCVIAGKEYGSGSSRDWAAKGPKLLGIKFVIAESYERIHRSNLVGMGILPLQFKEQENAQTLGLTGRETYDICGLRDLMKTKLHGRNDLKVRATADDGQVKEFNVTVRIDTPQEIAYYIHGGILNYVLRQLLSGKDDTTAVYGGVSSSQHSKPGVHIADKLVHQASVESFPASDSPAY